MKFGQLIEYNMRKIFLEKSYTRCGGEASPRPFYKKSKLNISLNERSEMLKVCFSCMSNGGLLKFIKTKVLATSFDRI